MFNLLLRHDFSTMTRQGVHHREFFLNGIPSGHIASMFYKHCPLYRKAKQTSQAFPLIMLQVGFDST